MPTMTATVEQHESCVSRATSSVEGASPAPATLDARRSWQSQRTLRPFGRLPTPGPRLRGRDPGLLWQKPGRDNRRKKNVINCQFLPGHATCDHGAECRISARSSGASACQKRGVASPCMPSFFRIFSKRRPNLLLSGFVPSESHSHDMNLNA